MTIRFRITALATLAVFAVLTATGVAISVAQRHVLTAHVDEALANTAAETARLARAGTLPAVLIGVGADESYAEVVDAGGAVLASSAPKPPPGDDASYRRVSRGVDTQFGHVVVRVAAPVDDIDESLATLRRSLVIAVPLTAIVLAAVVWWLVGRTLRPVEAIRAEVSEIEGADLHRRVPVPDTHDEIGRLARTMNDMLERVETTAERQRRFVGDASHELRSPLTRIRSELEVDLAHPDRADPAATHRSVLEEAIGLQRLVDDLLLLARRDARAATAGRGAVALDEVVAQIARRIQGDAGVSVDVAGLGAVSVAGDADGLARAVANVADNAGRHARSAVVFTLAAVERRAVLTITDDGPGIPPDENQRVFERFTRLDDSRTAATGGAGLGLAIAREIIEQHGGTIAVDASYRQGARFVVTLPLGSTMDG